jgi:hypothetical protein
MAEIAFSNLNDVVQKGPEGIRGAHREGLGPIIVQVREFDSACLEAVEITWLKHWLKVSRGHYRIYVNILPGQHPLCRCFLFALM